MIPTPFLYNSHPQDWELSNLLAFGQSLFSAFERTVSQVPPASWRPTEDLRLFQTVRVPKSHLKTETFHVSKQESSILNLHSLKMCYPKIIFKRFYYCITVSNNQGFMHSPSLSCPIPTPNTSLGIKDVEVQSFSILPG